MLCTIGANFSSYETKDHIFEEAKKQKLRDISVYHGFSKETVALQKKKELGEGQRIKKSKQTRSLGI